MKKSFSLIVSILAVVAFVFVSCDKDVETSPVSVDLSQKATVTGYLYADLDLTDAGLEPVPANIKVIVSVPNSDLLSNANGNWIDTVLTDASGKFVATVPTKASGVEVTVTTTDFVANQVQPLTSHYAATPIAKVYAGFAQSSFEILPGEAKIKVYEYGDPTMFKDFDNIVTIKGKAYAETDDNNSEIENSPLAEVVFSADGWSKKVTLVKNGVYTTFAIDVPSDKTIYYSWDFTAEKNVYVDSEWKKVLYRYKGTEYLGSFDGDTEDLDIDFGNGVEVE